MGDASRQECAGREPGGGPGDRISQNRAIKLVVVLSKAHHPEDTKSMRFFLYLLLGSILATPVAYSHGGHNHAPAEQIMIPGGNEDAIEINLYRVKSCGCCKKWGARMVKGGYKVVDHVSSNMDDLKVSEGISPSLASCHTAFVEGYFVEGHVPAKSIDKLLSEMPSIAGLSVPGMPLGSPGMETSPMAAESYKVLAVDFDGKVSVFESY